MTLCDSCQPLDAWGRSEMIPSGPCASPETCRFIQIHVAICNPLTVLIFRPFPEWNMWQLDADNLAEPDWTLPIMYVPIIS